MAGLTKQIVSLKYSRQDEKEADIGGRGYIVKAGYNPRGMLETMQILQSLNQGSSIDFFSTHPSPENRIGYITKKYSSNSNLKAGKEEFQNNILERLN